MWTWICFYLQYLEIIKKPPKYLRWHKQACRNVCKQRQKYESERSEKNPVWVSAAVSAGPSAKCLLKHETQVAGNNTHGNTQMRADCLCWCCRLNDRPHSSRSCPTHLYICSNTLQHREIWRHDGRVLLNAKELKNDRSYDCRSTETLWKFRFTIKWAKSVGLTAMAQWGHEKPVRFCPVLKMWRVPTAPFSSPESALYL